MSLRDDTGGRRWRCSPCSQRRRSLALARPAVGIDTSLPGTRALGSVKVSLSSAPGAHGQALQVEFDFAGTAGYAAGAATAARASANFEFSFYIRGTAPANNLQFKLLDGEAITCGGSIGPITSSRGLAAGNDQEAARSALRGGRAPITA